MKNFLLLIAIGAFLAVSMSSSCKKDLIIDPIDDPTIDTTYLIIEGVRVSNGAVSEYGHTHVKIKAEFAKIVAESFTIADYGHVVSKTTALPTIENNDGVGAAGRRAHHPW
ncbi:MAG: hypothetical protein IPJ40_24295 [Saprospirales bacterium]|nr:hypothetical protein [Saprospirales bacterium]